MFTLLSNQQAITERRRQFANYMYLSENVPLHLEVHVLSIVSCLSEKFIWCSLAVATAIYELG